MSVVTLAADHPDIASLFKPARVKNFRGKVLRDATTLAAEGMVRYTVTWEPSGSVLLVR